MLSVQILELQKKVERQNVITKKVKQANCSKWLQNQTQTLELHLNNVSKHFAVSGPSCSPYKMLFDQ